MRKKTKSEFKSFQCDDEGWIVGPMGERYGRLLYANRLFEEFLINALNEKRSAKLHAESLKGGK